MDSYRRLAAALAVLTLSLGGAVIFWLTGAGAAPASAKQVTPPGTQPSGVNFSIHSSVDPNFCLQDTPAPALPASEASMSQCAIRDGQHWTFAHAADGAVVIIGGDFGTCLDISASVSSPISEIPCTFRGGEQFFYSATGQIESTSGKKCLQPFAATQDAQVGIAKCDPAVPLQIWDLTH